MMGKNKLFGIITKSLNKSKQFTPPEREAIALAVATAIREYHQDVDKNFEETYLESMFKNIIHLRASLIDDEPLTDEMLARETWEDIVETRKSLLQLESKGLITLDAEVEPWVIHVIHEK